MNQDLGKAKRNEANQDILTQIIGLQTKYIEYTFGNMSHIAIELKQNVLNAYLEQSGSFQLLETENLNLGNEKFEAMKARVERFAQMHNLTFFNQKTSIMIYFGGDF